MFLYPLRSITLRSFPFHGDSFWGAFVSITLYKGNNLCVFVPLCSIYHFASGGTLPLVPRVVLDDFAAKHIAVDVRIDFGGGNAFMA